MAKVIQSAQVSGNSSGARPFVIPMNMITPITAVVMMFSLSSVSALNPPRTKEARM